MEGSEFTIMYILLISSIYLISVVKKIANLVPCGNKNVVNIRDRWIGKLNITHSLLQ